MEKTEKQSGFQLLPDLLVCMLLACAGLVFAVYTQRELSWLRRQILEHEKLIQTLQLRDNDRDIKGSKAGRIQRSAQDGAQGRKERSGNSGNGIHSQLGPSGFPEFVCQAKADVAFLVDSSWSIGPRNWRKMLQFLKDMVKAFNVGPDKTHIAVVTFSTEAQIEFNFDTQVTKEEYYQRIDKMRYQRRYSYMDEALFLADKEVFTVQAGMRPDFPKIAIVITFGKQTTRRATNTELSVALSELRLKNVQLYSLGIGKNADLQQLANITGSKDKVFYADSFATLAPVAQTIVQNSCPDKGMKPPVAPASERVVRASIYLAGDDTNLLNPVNPIISNWIVRDKIGSIQYDRGFIMIKAAGHYFIYSQMYYYDARTNVMAHYTYINNEKVMESIGSALTDSTKDNTRYHGGVFLLRVNDIISVRIPYIRHYNMKTDASFFGAVLLYPSESR